MGFYIEKEGRFLLLPVIARQPVKSNACLQHLCLTIFGLPRCNSAPTKSAPRASIFTTLNQSSPSRRCNYNISPFPHIPHRMNNIMQNISNPNNPIALPRRNAPPVGAGCRTATRPDETQLGLRVTIPVRLITFRLHLRSICPVYQ